MANFLGIPVFESVPEVQAWAAGQGPYSTVRYNEVTEEARKFGEKKDMKIALIDGPHWSQNGAEPDMEAIRTDMRRAEEAAIALFNGKVAAFTPHLNASYPRLGYRVPEALYESMNDRMLERVADCLFVTQGWEQVACIRARVIAAQKAGKPVFNSHNELFAWRDGTANHVTIRIG